MEKTIDKQQLPISEEEQEKFFNKVTKAWGEYMFDFYCWRRKVKKIGEKYSDGFGLGFPNMCVEIDDLFANFIARESKKSRDKKYKQYVLSLLETKLAEGDFEKIM